MIRASSVVDAIDGRHWLAILRRHRWAANVRVECYGPALGLIVLFGMAVCASVFRVDLAILTGLLVSVAFWICYSAHVGRAIGGRVGSPSSAAHGSG